MKCGPFAAARRPHSAPKVGWCHDQYGGAGAAAVMALRTSDSDAGKASEVFNALRAGKEGRSYVGCFNGP